MTLPNDSYDGFDSVTDKAPTYAVGRSTFVTQAPDGDVVKTARTSRSGKVTTATNYALVPNRKAGEDVLGRKAGHVVAKEDRKPITTKWQGMEDYDECPPSYAVWFKQYKGYTENLCWRMGIAPREIDDVVSEIMARFMERDSLGEFDRAWATRSATGTSVFRSYYSKFVVTYARGKHRNNVRHVKRNSLLMDAPVGDENGSTWGSQYAEAQAEGMSYDVEYEALVDGLRERVGEKVIDTVLQMVEENGKVPLTALAKSLAVSPREARKLRDKLQVAAREIIS